MIKRIFLPILVFIFLLPVNKSYTQVTTNPKGNSAYKEVPELRVVSAQMLNPDIHEQQYNYMLGQDTIYVGGQYDPVRLEKIKKLLTIRAVVNVFCTLESTYLAISHNNMANDLSEFLNDPMNGSKYTIANSANSTYKASRYLMWGTLGILLFEPIYHLANNKHIDNYELRKLRIYNSYEELVGYVFSLLASSASHSGNLAADVKEYSHTFDFNEAGRDFTKAGNLYTGAAIIYGTCAIIRLIQLFRIEEQYSSLYSILANVKIEMAPQYNYTGFSYRISF